MISTTGQFGGSCTLSMRRGEIAGNGDPCCSSSDKITFAFLFFAADEACDDGIDGSGAVLITIQISTLTAGSFLWQKCQDYMDDQKLLTTKLRLASIGTNVIDHRHVSCAWCVIGTRLLTEVLWHANQL